MGIFAIIITIMGWIAVVLGSIVFGGFVIGLFLFVIEAIIYEIFG